MRSPKEATNVGAYAVTPSGVVDVESQASEFAVPDGFECSVQGPMLMVTVGNHPERRVVRNGFDVTKFIHRTNVVAHPKEGEGEKEFPLLALGWMGNDKRDDVFVLAGFAFIAPDDSTWHTFESTSDPWGMLDERLNAQLTGRDIHEQITNLTERLSKLQTLSLFVKVEKHTAFLGNGVVVDGESAEFAVLLSEVGATFEPEDVLWHHATISPDKRRLRLTSYAGYVEIRVEDVARVYGPGSIVLQLTEQLTELRATLHEIQAKQEKKEGAEHV